MSTFRTISSEAPAQSLPVAEPDGKTTLTDTVEGIEPVGVGDNSIFEALGVQDNLPADEKNNVLELEGYVFEVLKTKGIDPTLPAVKHEIETLKNEMGLDENASVQTVIDRMGGVVKAWKNLSFVKDPQEKRRLFFRLANAPTSKDMNRIVFDEYERKSVWQ